MIYQLFEGNIYGKNGLADTVFTMAITNSFLSPALRVFNLNLSSIIRRIKKWRNENPYYKLKQNYNQKKLNSELYSYSQF